MRLKAFALPAAAAFLSAALLLQGCGLLPEEKVRREAPILETETEKRIYTCTIVQRATIRNAVQTEGKVVGVRSSTVRFPSDDVEISERIVRIGDEVREGDVLATVDIEEIQEQLEEAESQLRLMQLQQTYQKNVGWLQLSREKIILGRLTDGAAIDAQNEAIRMLEWECYSRNMQLAAQVAQLEQDVEVLQAKVDAGTLTADMDGVIVGTGDGGRSYEICDESALFVRVEKENAAAFEPGREVEVRNFNRFETLTVLSAEEAGFENDGAIYVKLDELAENLAPGKTCTLSYVESEADDVLCLSDAAIREVDGKVCVYIQDEDGLITVREIETGISGDGVTEILSGLDEGQEVILSY